MIFLARLQVLKWHRATYHTHTVCAEARLALPVLPPCITSQRAGISVVKSLASMGCSWKDISSSFAKDTKTVCQTFGAHFLRFVYLPMFGSKTWTKFWNSRLCGYGTDTSIHWWLFRRCSWKGWNEGMLVGQRHLAVESCMAVYNLYEECWHCWLWMALTQLCAVMRSGEPGLLGVFDYEYEEYDCCAHHEPNPTTFSSKLLWLPTYNMYTLEVQDHQNNSPQFWMIKFPTKKIVLRENLSF